MHPGHTCFKLERGIRCLYAGQIVPVRVLSWNTYCFLPSSSVGSVQMLVDVIYDFPHEWLVVALSVFDVLHDFLSLLSRSRLIHVRVPRPCDVAQSSVNFTPRSSFDSRSRLLLVSIVHCYLTLTETTVLKAQYNKYKKGGGSLLGKDVVGGKVERRDVTIDRFGYSL